MTFTTVSTRASWCVPRAQSAQFATTSSTSSLLSRFPMNKNTHHSCISISRRIQHHHRSCSLRAKKKTYESSEEAAEDLLFYNEEDLLEEDEEWSSIQLVTLQVINGLKSRAQYLLRWECGIDRNGFHVLVKRTGANRLIERLYRPCLLYTSPSPRDRG